MTAVSASNTPPPPPGPLPSAAGAGGPVPIGPIVHVLVMRSLIAMRRIPGAIGPILAMPIFFLVAFSGSYAAIVNLPGFPTDNILNWFVPYACIQGAAFSGMGIGYATARDIESGFFDRLMLSPAPRWFTILGAIGTALTRALLPLLTVFPIGLALGADFPGILGFAALAFTAFIVSTAAGLWALGLVYRYRSQRILGLVQIGIFASLFLSIGQVPMAVMEGWLHGAARFNPTTNLLRMARQGFLDELSWAMTWPGIVAGAGILAVLTLWAITGYRRLIS